MAWVLRVAAAGTCAVLGGGAVGLAVLRLTDPVPTRLVEATALVPLGPVLASLLLLVAVLALATSRSRRWWAVVALALVLTVAHVGWQLPLVLGAVPEPEGSRVVVLAQNAEDADRDGLGAAFADVRPDVVVLSDLTQELAQAARGAGAAAGLVHSTPQSSGTIVLSRYPLGPPEPVTPDGSSLLVEVTVPTVGAVSLVAAHPAPPYVTPTWRSDHAAVLDRVAAMVADPQGPVLVAGDLNAVLDHAPMRRLRDLGCQDAVVQANAGWLPTWPAPRTVRRAGLSLPPFAALDHVLTCHAGTTTGVRTVTVPGADHRGVVAVLSLRAAGSESP